MSTINSSTTGHSRPQERQFAKKLFLGLFAAVIVAFVIAVLIGRKNPTVRTVPSGSSSTNSTSAPEPISEQPRN